MTLQWILEYIEANSLFYLRDNGTLVLDGDSGDREVGGPKS